MSLVSSLILKTRWGALPWIMVTRAEPRWKVSTHEVARAATCKEPNHVRGYASTHAKRVLRSLTNDSVSFVVATVVFLTSTLIAIRMIYVKYWAIIVAVVFFLFKLGFHRWCVPLNLVAHSLIIPYGTLGLFRGGALRKVPTVH